MYVLKESPSCCVENKVWGHRSSRPLERILQVNDDGSWDQCDNGVVQRGDILGPIEVGDEEMQGGRKRGVRIYQAPTMCQAWCGKPTFKDKIDMKPIVTCSVLGM